ncbi:hypothetical protein FGG08_001768 [Glutinoglossum americanum]|uniref:SprT-like domain-containing protein n=1 Tax=Glutinoglossum americanum TaxID=1670608 RepID=A0A9P8IAQ0_9PEZI|nr:hypothetical protein FGG08_001768 [Glutinoglossum americanum]
MARLREEHEESDDEFPDISVVISRFYQNKLPKTPNEERSCAEEPDRTGVEDSHTRYGVYSTPNTDSMFPTSGPHAPVKAPNTESPAKFDSGSAPEVDTFSDSLIEDDSFAMLKFSPPRSKIVKDSPTKQSCAVPSFRPIKTPSWDREIQEQGGQRKKKTPWSGRRWKPRPIPEPIPVQGIQPHTPGKTKQHRSTLSAKKAFKERKHDLAREFLSELDDRVSGGQIASITASTGGVKLIWSKKLTTTAGRANWKKEKIAKLVTDEALRNIGSQSVAYRHIASIELAEKVIDDENRLLNTLAHEYCHLANFIISEVLDHPHGESFKEWAKICTRAFGHRGVEVTTKHSYAIDYKYIWECTGCGVQFKRHSKSVDPTRHTCGSCKSQLVQIQPAPRSVALSEYQLFVKENFKEVKKAHPLSPQKEIMGLLGAAYKRERKTTTATETTGGKGAPPGPEDSEEDLYAITSALGGLDLGNP